MTRRVEAARGALDSAITAVRIALRIFRRHVIVHQLLKRCRKLIVIALQRHEFLSININGQLGSSPVPGRLIPIFAAFDSPGPFTMQPITASFSSSTPV